VGAERVNEVLIKQFLNYLLLVPKAEREDQLTK
jgi:hypothetical protein